MDLRLFLLLLVTTVLKTQDTVLSDDGQGPNDDGQEPSIESVELDQSIPKILIVGPTG